VAFHLSAFLPRVEEEQGPARRSSERCQNHSVVALLHAVATTMKMAMKPTNRLDSFLSNFLSPSYMEAR